MKFNSSDLLECLDESIVAQQAMMQGYEKESEALTIETVRALDCVLFEEFIPELRNASERTSAERLIMQAGVNEALRRVLPKSLARHSPERFVASTKVHDQVDGFLFDAGVLAMAKRQRILLSQGLLSGYIDPRSDAENRILVLDAQDSSTYWEAIGLTGMEWLSAETMKRDQGLEAELEQMHLELMPSLERQFDRFGGEFGEIFDGLDGYFREWAQLYLKRMPYQDLLGLNDVIGCCSYGRYVDVLTAISTLCQMRICYARLAYSRRPDVSIRSLLSQVVSLEDLIEGVTSFLDAESHEIEYLLQHLILSKHNFVHHFDIGTPAWAPVIRTSQIACVLPSFGMDINPFSFLLRELRVRHKDDWFTVANRREERWVAELVQLFPGSRWSCSNGRKLKNADGTVATDVDFLAYDSITKQLALFQLKWQQPAMGDETVRRSNGRNFLKQCNEWVVDVHAWLARFGVGELTKRAGIKTAGVDRIVLINLARYSAFMPETINASSEATWSDWGHFLKHRLALPNASPTELADAIKADISRTQAELTLESIALPLPGCALIVNPVQRPR
ncbi:hypothetical protein [Chitinimonas naiadis]